MMEFLSALSSNLEAIAAGAVIILIGADKLAIIFISTLKNVRDAWYSAFPKFDDDDDDDDKDGNKIGF
jgi:hypothetical protein